MQYTKVDGDNRNKGEGKVVKNNFTRLKAESWWRTVRGASQYPLDVRAPHFMKNYFTIIFNRKNII